MICNICIKDIDTTKYDELDLCEKCKSNVDEIKKLNYSIGTPEKIKCSWE
jgi:hypothetical protein